MMKATVRLWVEGELTKEWVLTKEMVEDERWIPKTLAEYVGRKERLHMLEIEFPDLPEGERYLRVGTDPRWMVDPMLVDVEEN